MEGAQKKWRLITERKGELPPWTREDEGGREGNAQVRLEWKSLRRIPIVRFELIL